MKMIPLALATTVLLITSTSFGQSTVDSTLQVRESPRSWFLGGVAVTQRQFGWGGGLFFGLGGAWALGARGGFQTEKSLFIQPAEYSWWVNPMVQFTPLYGSVGMVSIGLGAGITGGIHRGALLRQVLLVAEHDEITYQVPSLTAELQLALFVSRSLGFTVTGFTNVNKEPIRASFFGWRSTAATVTGGTTESHDTTD